MRTVEFIDENGGGPGGWMVQVNQRYPFRKFHLAPRDL
jgi:hypothetical protein